MQRLEVSPIQHLFTSKIEDGSETMKVAGKPGNIANELEVRVKCRGCRNAYTNLENYNNIQG